jgi:hypothetical protein
MNFSSFKNTNPIYFYFISISSFVLANIARSKSIDLYYFLLIIGVIFFVIGMVRRVKSK